MEGEWGSPGWRPGRTIVDRQDFIPGAEARFWLSRDFEDDCHTWDSRGQAYDVLVRFFPCKVYIDLNCRDTLGYEWLFAHCCHLIVCLVFPKITSETGSIELKKVTMSKQKWFDKLPAQHRRLISETRSHMLVGSASNQQNHIKAAWSTHMQNRKNIHHPPRLRLQQRQDRRWHERGNRSISASSRAALAPITCPCDIPPLSRGGQS
jgi:hypothetical protein